MLVCGVEFTKEDTCREMYDYHISEFTSLSIFQAFDVWWITMVFCNMDGDSMAQDLIPRNLNAPTPNEALQLAMPYIHAVYQQFTEALSGLKNICDAFNSMNEGTKNDIMFR